MAVPVFFMPEMVADSRGYSPSAAKPWLVVRAWETCGLPIEVRSFEPCSPADIALAHDPVFVEGVLSGKLNNGHGNKSLELAATLPYTCGSMVAALDEALTNGIGAVSPTSGFHHAGRGSAGAFCTFNGLMVAALKHPELRIGILDFDYHYGNGTQDIIDRQSQSIVHYSQGKYKDPPAEKWLKGIAPAIRNKFKDCDAVLYQAGQDPHVDDPLGGWLTTDQLMLRDTIVFNTLRGMGVPVVWNLAGGYTDPFSTVINGHVNTMFAFSHVFSKG